MTWVLQGPSTIASVQRTPAQSHLIRPRQLSADPKFNMRTAKEITMTTNSQNLPVGPLFLSLALSLAGAAAVWLITSSVTYAMTSGAAGFVLGGGIYLALAMSGREERQ